MVVQSASLRVTPSLPVHHTRAVSGFPQEHSRPCDPRRYRALYPDLWFAFLRAHFRDPVEVAYFFGVDAKTGKDWWEGVSRSQGWAVAYAIENIPTAAAFLRAA
jgi:hypothetical protein